MLSKRRCGKTVLCETILNKLLDTKKIDVVYIFSSTSHLGDNWRTIPDKYKYEYVDFNKIQKINNKQTDLVKKKSPKVQQIALVFDDVIENNTDGRSELLDCFNFLYSKSRHYAISVFLNNQYCKSICSPTLRSNCDYVFLSVNTSEVLGFVYSLVIYKGTKQEFINFINEHAGKDHYFIMYDNVKTDNSERFFKVKADMKYLESKIGKNKY